MARPKKPDDQRRDVSRLVRFTHAEDTALLQRANSAGMNVSDFLRETSLKRRFIPRPPLAEAEFLLYMRGEIGRTGNNLSLLVEQLNSAQQTLIEQEAQAVIKQLQEVNNIVIQLLRYGYSGEKQG